MADDNENNEGTSPTPQGRSYDEMMADPNLSEEELDRELNLYAEALKKELEQKNTEEPELIADNMREFYKQQSANAAAQIAWLSINAFSESVKLSASKFICQQATADEKESHDPMAELLRELRKVPTAAATDKPAPPTNKPNTEPTDTGDQ